MYDIPAREASYCGATTRGRKEEKGRKKGENEQDRRKGRNDGKGMQCPEFLTWKSWQP